MRYLWLSGTVAGRPRGRDLLDSETAGMRECAGGWAAERIPRGLGELQV